MDVRLAREARLRAGRILGCWLFGLAVALLPAAWADTAEAGIIIDSDVRYVAVGSSGEDYHGPYSNSDRIDHDGSTPEFVVSMNDWLSSTP